MVAAKRSQTRNGTDVNTANEQELVAWHGPSGAWYATALITFGLAGLAYLLGTAALGVASSAAPNSTRTITLLVIAGAALLAGLGVAVYPRPKPTRLGYVRDTVKRCVRGSVCSLAFSWSVLSFVDTSAFGVAPIGQTWILAITQLAGLVIAAVLWDPAQKRILRAWLATVKGYSMSATGAAQ